MSDPRQPRRIYRPESLVGTLHHFTSVFLDSTERIAIETAAAGADADSKDN